MLKRYKCWKDRTYIQSTNTELALVNETEEGENESGEEEELAFELV